MMNLQKFDLCHYQNSNISCDWDALGPTEPAHYTDRGWPLVNKATYADYDWRYDWGFFGPPTSPYHDRVVMRGARIQLAKKHNISLPLNEVGLARAVFNRWIKLYKKHHAVNIVGKESVDLFFGSIIHRFREKYHAHSNSWVAHFDRDFLSKAFNLSIEANPYITNAILNNKAYVLNDRKLKALEAIKSRLEKFE